MSLSLTQGCSKSVVGMIGLWLIAHGKRDALMVLLWVRVVLGE